MRESTKPTGLLACLLTAALGWAGCASDEEEPEGGVARIAYSAQPDSLDPAKTYSLEGAAIVWTVYTGPLTYRHADGRAGTDVVPGLAEEMPRVSGDGLTYRFRFRPGLRYSDGTELKASDFEHSVKRVLVMASPASRFFLGIEGAQRFLKRNRLGGDIAGISADDASGEVTVRLTAPDGTFVNALAGPFAGPVPKSAGAQDMTKKPPPGIGAFRIAQSVPNRRIVLARNERLPDLPAVPAPRLDRVEVRIGANPRLEAQRIARNRLDYMVDPIPADMLAEIKREHPERYEENVTNSTFYFWLNSSMPPFDDHTLRQAVHTAIDKHAISRLYGGLMRPTCNFLPPGMPAHEPLDPCPYGDASGDIERAQAMVKRAGAVGTEVRVWGPAVEPSEQVVQYYANVLEQIGLRPKLEIVSPSLYFQTIGNESTKRAHTGFANWFQEFPHPASFMAAVRGDLITPTANYNFSRTDIPALTNRIKRLQAEAELEPFLAEWAGLDREVIEDAGVVPYGNLVATTFMSDRMDFEECSPAHPVYAADYSRFCLKP